VRYRKRPIEVDAVPWLATEASYVEVHRFTGGAFRWREHAELTAEVYDALHDTWVALRTGDWIIRGVRSEFYPCRDSVFRDTYEAVSD
jgi:hypothetical protein